MKCSMMSPNRVALLPLLVSILAAPISCTDAPAPITELISTDIVVGDGKESVDGKSVSVHYTGWVYDPSKEDNRGVRFDSSRDRGVPFTFTPGREGVIEGWSRGVQGMKIGGVRELIIPPDMAYGNQVAARGKIPANSTLLFEIELLIVRK